MYEKQNDDKKDILKIKNYKKYLYIIMIFDIIRIFGKNPTEEIFKAIILLLTILAGFIRGTIYFKVTGKKRTSIFLGILSCFNIINIFVTVEVLSKVKSYLNNNIEDNN